jgi:hypothetical protein
MICQHCGIEHTITMEWPSQWDDDRKKRFVSMVSSFGVMSGYAASMASELDRLSRESEYVVNEGELRKYLCDCKVSSIKLANIQKHRQTILKWASVFDPVFRLKSGPCCLIMIQAILLIFICPVLFLLTIPFRVYIFLMSSFATIGFHSTFIGWLKVNGKLKNC